MDHYKSVLSQNKHAIEQPKVAREPPKKLSEMKNSPTTSSGNETQKSGLMQESFQNTREQVKSLHAIRAAGSDHGMTEKKQEEKKSQSSFGSNPSMAEIAIQQKFATYQNNSINFPQDSSGSTFVSFPLQQQTQSSVKDTTSKSASGKCIPRDYPVVKVPISLNYMKLLKPENFETVMRILQKTLGGELNVERACLRSPLDEETTLKAAGFRDSTTGAVYVEFNRLEGCAFLFQQKFVEAKRAVKDFIEIEKDSMSLDEEEKLVNDRLQFWKSPLPLPAKS